MRLALFISLLISGLFLTAQTPQVETKKISGESCSFEIPTDWITEKLASKDIMIYPQYEKVKSYGGAVNLISEYNSDKNNINEYIFLTKNSLSQFHKALITKEEDKEINGLQAHVIFYEIKGYEIDELGIMYIFHTDSKAFQLSFKGNFTDFKQNEILANIIASSFKIQ